MDCAKRLGLTWETRFLPPEDEKTIKMYAKKHAEPPKPTPYLQKSISQYQLSRLRFQRKMQAEALRNVRVRDIEQAVVESALFISECVPATGVHRRRPYSAGLKTAPVRYSSSAAPMSVCCVRQ